MTVSFFTSLFILLLLPSYFKYLQLSDESDGSPSLMTITNTKVSRVTTPQVHTTSTDSIENVKSAYNQLKRDRSVIMLVGYTTLTSPFVMLSIPQAFHKKNMII